MMNLGTLSLTTTVKSSKPMVSLSFWIPYFTHWGQSLLVCGSAPGLGSGNVKKGLLLKPSQQEDQLVWSGSVSVPPGFTCDYCYYVVDDLKNVLRSEFGMKRKLVVPEALTGGESVQLRDLWQSGDQALPFRSAFKDVIFRNTGDVEVGKPLGVFENKSDQDDSVVVQFKICCPDVGEGTSVYVLGTSGKLGKWKVESGLKLNYVGDSMWEGDCLIPKAEFPIKYRYCKVPKDGSIGLESGGNRELTLHSFSNKQEYIVMSDGLFREMPWRGAGVAVPMFSVRSEDDVGVGEFLDLKLLVDWSVDSGLHLVQLLPVNDTSVHKMWWDSYPYSSLSVFALHPLYLRVQALSESLPADIKEEIEKAKKQLDKNDVDYEATMETKLSIAKKIFDLEKDQTLSSSSFQKYFSENEGWLKPYAAFCFLRDFFETSDHSQWGTFSDYTEDKLEKLTSKDSLHYNTICFHYYIQYHLHVQLSEASEYAEEKGRIGRRNFASNYTGANNGRSGAFTRQSGANHRIRRPIKASKPLIPPSGVSNPKITEEYPPSKSASSSEDVTELKSSIASETVPVSDSVVQNGTQYAVDGTSTSCQQSSTSSQQSATSNCGSLSDQVTRSEAAAPNGTNQSLLRSSDVGERPHVTFPVHLQVAKMLENGLTFGSFDSNFVKETFCDNCSIGCEDPTIKSSHGTASSEASAREDVSSVPQDKDHEISNVAPETELQLVEGSEVDKLNEESLPIKDTHQAANCDSPPISYPDQCSLAASQQAMHLLRQQYPLNFCPYGLYYPQPFYMPQPYIHQFLTPNAFQQQSYLPPQDDAPAPPGDELLLPQIKSGANIGNSPPTTFPSPYDSYAGAFNHIPSPVKEEQKEDSYTTGPVSLANLQASAMYNLSLQGQPLVFPTLQAGFTGIYQQAQPIPPPPAIPSMAEQPIGLPLITNQQPQAAPTNMDNNY